MKKKKMDFAELDLERKKRTGFAEVVYCAGKTPEHARKPLKMNCIFHVFMLY